MPHAIATGDDAIQQVKQVGIKTMYPLAALLEDRFARATWWYGDQWSIVDAYVFWAWSRMVGEGFPTEDFPKARDHCQRIQDRPSVQRAMEREAVNLVILAQA